MRVRLNGATYAGLEGSTADNPFHLHRVSTIQLDPEEAPEAGKARRPRREIVCQEENPESECPFGVP